MTAKTYAALTWSSTDQTSVERVHLLAEPLRRIRPAHNETVYRSESLDKTNIETFVVSSGRYELIGTVKFDQRAQSLIDALRAGSEGETLTYIPDRRDPDVKYQCKLIAPIGVPELNLDDQLGVRGHQSVEVRLALTTEGPFQPLYEGTEVLFSYDAGDSLEQATFTRSGTATRVTNSGGGGYGTLSTTPSGQARVSWFATASSVGPRTEPAYLTEGSRINRVTESEDFGSWSNIGTPVATSEQADPYGGTNAWLVARDTTVGSEAKFLEFAVGSTALLAMSIYVREGTTASTVGTAILLLDPSTVTRINATVTWASGLPSVDYVNGSSVAVPERYRGGWWRIFARTTVGHATGNWDMRVYPSAIGNQPLGDVYVFGAQVES